MKYKKKEILNMDFLFIKAKIILLAFFILSCSKDNVVVGENDEMDIENLAPCDTYPRSYVLDSSMTVAIVSNYTLENKIIELISEVESRTDSIRHIEPTVSMIEILTDSLVSFHGERSFLDRTYWFTETNCLSSAVEYYASPNSPLLYYFFPSEDCTQFVTYKVYSTFDSDNMELSGEYAFMRNDPHCKIDFLDRVITNAINNNDNYPSSYRNMLIKFVYQLVE